MWSKIIEILLPKLLQQPTPKERLTEASVRLYRDMVPFHGAYSEYKRLTADGYSHWLGIRNTDDSEDDFDARWAYWERAFSISDDWGKAIEKLVDTAYEFQEVLDIFDPDVLEVINNYIEQESYGYKFQRLTPLTRYLAQNMPGSRLGDPGAVHNQERDAADFKVAIDEFRNFLVEKLELSPEDVYAAR